jgi:hypothetical protein
MNGGSFGQRGSYGSLPCYGKLSNIARKQSSKMPPVSSRDKERVLLVVCRCLGRRRVAMLLLVALALLVFIWGSLTVSKGMVQTCVLSYDVKCLSVLCILLFYLSLYFGTVAMSYRRMKVF